MYFEEPFSHDERQVLDRYFTNTDSPVFALVNLPEVVKGALFARYSRSPKSLRRLFLEEFHDKAEIGIDAIADRMGDGTPGVRLKRAEKLYDRVFTEYGDDSVAQLGGAHLACEQASNILTKVLEWGRLAAYLEQSTRYIYYDERLGGSYRYFVPPEVAESALGPRFTAELDALFDDYSSVVQRLKSHFEEKYPKQDGDSNFVWRATIRAKACDAARGLLPAATRSNVGIFASGQAYESMLLRMWSHPLAEARDYAVMMLAELRHVIPAFLRRVDVPERGGAWAGYMADVRGRMDALAGSVEAEPEPVEEVTLTEWDPDAEKKLAAAALYAHTDLPDSQLLKIGEQMSEADRANVLRTYVGDRKNRRHKPGRAFERSFYRFDVLSDFGSFRDLQRHRMLTLEWQKLSPRHGYTVPPAVEEVGGTDEWHATMGRMAELHRVIEAELGADVAQYAVPFGYRMRYFMQLNVREAFHLLELRTAQQGHPDYRRICQEMHRLIKEKAGHRLLADAMSYVDHNEYDLERLEAERRAEKRRQEHGGE